MDEQFNPAQRDAEQKFAFRPEQAIDRARQAEMSGQDLDSEYAREEAERAKLQEVEYDSGEAASEMGVKGLFGKFTSKLKKSGPIATVTMALLGGGTIFSLVMLPSSAINHFVERMTETFNYQETSANRRIKKNDFKKPISQSRIDRLKKAGFDVEVDPKKGLFGRQKVKKITAEIDGKKVTFDDLDSDGGRAAFNKALDSDPKLRADYKGANGFLRSMTTDSIYDMVSRKYRFSRQGLDSKKTKADADDIDTDNNPDADQEKAKRNRKNLNQQFDDIVDGNIEHEKIDVDNIRKKIDDDIDNRTRKGGDGAPSVKNIEDSNSKIAAATDLAEDTYKSRAAGKKNPHKNFKGASKVAAAFNVLDVADDLCGYYRVIKGAVMLGKIAKAVMMARPFIALLISNGKIKAGEATEEEIAFFGNMLMGIDTPSTDYEKGLSGLKTSFDSAGFDYTEGRAVDQDDKSYQAARLGASGGLWDVYHWLTSDKVGATIKGTCGVFKYNEISGVMMIVGIVGLFTAPIALVATSVLKMAATSIAVGIVKQKIQSTISSALTGDFVSHKTNGEAFGNAAASGAGYAFGRLSNAAGNTLMTQDQALAYLDEQDRYIAQVGEEIRATHSPFDATTRHTMVGSIVHGFVPHMAKMATIGGRFSSLTAVAMRSLASLLPITKASDQANRKHNLGLCDDKSYTKMLGENSPMVAFDPFCNPILGLPNSHLDIDPEDVVKEMRKKRYLKPANEKGDCFIDDDTSTYYSSMDESNPCGDDYFWKVNNDANQATNPNKQGKLEDYYYERCSGKDGKYVWRQTGLEVGSKWEDHPCGNNKEYRFFHSQKLYQRNPLLRFYQNCVLRGDIPYGMDDIDDQSEWLLAKLFEDNGMAYDKGESCVVQADDEDKAYYAAYFMDKRIQCILSGDSNCPEMEEVKRYGSETEP